MLRKNKAQTINEKVMWKKQAIVGLDLLLNAFEHVHNNN